jgi:protein SCO1/2
MTLRRRTLVAVLPLAVLAACGEKKPQFHAIDISGAEYAKGFDLPDQDGRERKLSDFKGEAVVVFFGYTQCPDVCPTTMAEIAQAKKLLGPQGDKVQGVFVTIDPERDTPQVLKGYMANFDTSFVALRPTADQLAAMAKEFKVYYKKVEGKTPGTYTMDHSAACFVFDPQGRVRLYTRYGGGAQALADDLAQILEA